MNSIRFDRRRYFLFSLPLVVLIAAVGVTILVRTVRESQFQADAARRLQEFTEKAIQISLSYEDWSGEIWESDPASLERYNSKYEDGWISWLFKHRESGAEVSVLLCRGRPAPICDIRFTCPENTSATFVVATEAGIVPFQLETSPDYHNTGIRHRLHRTWTIDGTWLAPRWPLESFRFEDRPFCLVLVSEYNGNHTEELDRLFRELARHLLPEIQQVFF